jgi:biopolymer transport protein ExbD
MRRILLPIAAVVLLLPACRRGAAVPTSGVPVVEEKPEAPCREIKIKVAADGEIIADGQTVSLEQIAALLAQLKKENGGVCIHWERPPGGRHPNAAKVMDLVYKHNLYLLDFSVSNTGAPAKVE